MSAQANRIRDSRVAAAPHPNDVDRKRIERALAKRARYRYVSPTVRPAQDGYLITSPCCSRNVDPQGGEIDIAWLEFEPRQGNWRLLRKDHATGAWVQFWKYPSLMTLLDYLNQDPERLFWQ